jgi:hypothetical protein
MLGQCLAGYATCLLDTLLTPGDAGRQGRNSGEMGSLGHGGEVGIMTCADSSWSE